MVRIAQKATKGKGKRWLKGHSSTSNPESKKHRAKVNQNINGASNATNQIVGSNKFKLTKDLLEKFDAIQSQKQRLSSTENIDASAGGVNEWLNNHANHDNTNGIVNYDTISLGNVSAASIWSNCSNVSFDKFLIGFDAKSKMHKAMLTVLATIRDAIEKENGTESETEYFAGLMVTLNCVDTEEQLTATLALIQMVLKRVPESVLKLKFVETTNIMLKILTERLNAPNGFLIKSIIGILAILLRNQDKQVWEYPLAQKIFRTMLSMILHNRPRIRKAAMFSVISIVSPDVEGEQESGTMVARKLVAEFAITKLEEHLTTTQDEHLHILLYVLSLLSDTMFQFPSPSHTKQACESILSHMTLGNVLVVNGALQTFYSFFMRRPTSEVLSPELNAQLLNALYDYQPNINDEQPLNAWCTALKEGLLSLHNLDSNLSHLHLVKFIKMAIACLASDSNQVHGCVCNAINVVFNEIVLKSDDETRQSILVNDECLSTIFSELKGTLNYQFSHSWLQVIPMLKELFVDSKSISDTMGPIMQRMAILRESNDSELSQAIDGYFGKAIAFYGPVEIVRQCPINWHVTDTSLMMNGQESEFKGEFTNPWLLSLLRDHSNEKSELALFNDHFLPLADSIGKKAISCKKLADHLQSLNSEQMETDQSDGSSNAYQSCLVASRELERCVHALWCLFPAFCRKPIDVDKVFPKLAQRLGETLNNRFLCQYPLAGLRNLLKCSEEVTSSVAPYAKNYLPILFNLYTNENENTRIEDGLRLPVLKLAEQFVPHLFINETSIQVFRRFYENIEKLLVDINCTEFRRIALLDLLGALLSSPKGFNRSDLEHLYREVAKPLIMEHGKVSANQKKGFKILEQIFTSSSTECIQFVKENLREMVEFLTSLISNPKCFIATSTRAMSLRIIRRLIEHHLTSNNNSGISLMVFYEKVLSCVLDCLLLKSSKAIKNAELLLSKMFEVYDALNFGEGQLMVNLLEPFNNGTSKEMNINQRLSRLKAINFIYEEKYLSKITVSNSLLCEIIDVVLRQISPSSELKLNRQILDVCFNFIGTFFRNASPEVLNSYLEMITCSITNLPPEHRTKYRMKIKVLLVKLIRKYDYEFISSMISEDYHKVLKNIKKLEERKKKKRSQRGDFDDENEDESVSDNESDRKSRKSRKSRRKFSASSDEDEAEIEQFIDDEWGNNMDDDDDDDGATSFTKRKMKNLDIMSRLSTKTNKTFIREDVDGDPLDLLSPNATRNVFSKIPKKFKQPIDGGAETKTQLKKVPISDDGRLMINELFDQIEAKDGGEKRSSLKRTLDDNNEDDEDDEAIEEDLKSHRSGGVRSNYKPGGRGIHRPISGSGESVSGQTNRSHMSRKSSKSNRKQKQSEQINRGDAYRSKKAAGDMKRRGMPDPYAYIPMNPVALNRRKSAKYKGELKAIVKGAKKGAAVGSQARKRMRTSK